MTTGLRERKKARTRANIAAQALALFQKQGFERTTVAEIAEAAEVSPRTYFSYFATKEEAVFEKDFDLEAMRERLADRRPGESAVDALRAWIAEMMADPDWSEPDEIARRSLIRETPALAAYEMAHIEPRFTEIFAEAVAADLGIEPHALGPQMVAAAVSAALRTLTEHFAAAGDAAGAEHQLDQLAAFLKAGLASLR